MSPVPETRILFVGDMHLGRLPGGLPAVLDTAQVRPAAALRKVVALARAKAVHAVAFTGDLVDGNNALFEAFGPLKESVAELIGEGIEVVAVAGNHDTDVLPRLAGIIGSGFHLLGPAGTWSSHLVPGMAPLPVRLVGWSFPAPQYGHSPLNRQAPPARENEITLGLLHADLDAAQSPYAPVTTTQLKSCGYQGWFLGHIHRPDPATNDGTPMYMGSLTPLDPTETSLHGPMLVTIKSNASLVVERLPLAPLRWEHLTLDCTGLANPAENLLSFLVAAMDHRLEELGPDTRELKALGFRITLRGRVARPSTLYAAAAALPQEDMVTTTGALTMFTAKLTCEVTGAHDLARMAAQSDPVGLFARRILALADDAGQPPAPIESLLNDAEHINKELTRKPEYALLAVESTNLDPAALRRILIRVAYRILDSLVEEKEGDHGSG